MKHKIYVGASYPRIEEAKALKIELEKLGYDIVSSWLLSDNEGYDTSSTEHLRMCAIRDFEEIEAANSFVCLTDGEEQLTHGGRHTELGIALALKKDIWLIGPRESVFHYHDCVLAWDNIKEFIGWVELWT